jgi:hypothetical protein
VDDDGVGAVEHADQPGQVEPAVVSGQVGGTARGGRDGRFAAHVASCK